MKKLGTFLILLLFITSSPAQKTIFSENMGAPSNTTSITASIFQNRNLLTFSTNNALIGTRPTSPSTGYSGASGAGNVYFSANASVNSFFSIGGINASNFTSLSLQFGYRKESTSALPTLGIEYWNGSAWIKIAATLFSQSTSAPSTWYLSNAIALPAAAQINNLQLRFVKTGATDIRIDDVRLTGVETPPTVINAVVSNVTSTSATFSGNVTATGGSSILATGTVYAATSTNASPILGGSGVIRLTTPNPNSGIAAFTNNSQVALLPNVQYSYTSYATKSTGLTGYGTVATFHTLAATPTAPIITNIKAKTLDIAIGNDNNSAATTYAIAATSAKTVRYVQNDGTLGATAVYQNRASWGTTKTIIGLSPSTAYSFKVIAKNSLGITTDAINSANATTLIGATITITGTLSALNTIYGESSLATSFSLTASNLIGSLNIEAPFGFEVSITTGGTTGYASKQVIAPSAGAIAARIIYFRLATITAVGTYSGTINLKSDNDQLNVNFPASSVAKRKLTITGIMALNKAFDTTNLATLSGTAVLIGVQPSDNSNVVLNATSATATFNDATIGMGKPVTVSGYTISGSAVANYLLTQPSGLSAAITANASSDIVLHSDSQTSINANIDYRSYQVDDLTNTTSSIGVMGFYVRDGGAGLNDPDNLGTALTAITFNILKGATNIRSARLFNANTPLGLSTTVKTVSGLSFIEFTGLNVTVPDNSQLALNLRVTFKNVVSDNDQMEFIIANVTAGTAGSRFATFNGGGAQSRVQGDINRIEVSATKLAFVNPVSNSFVGAKMNPSPIVEARDDNNIRDLDFSGTITITSSGTLSSSQMVAATNGSATFNNINHTLVGAGLKLTATAPGLNNPALSNTFTINSLIIPQFNAIAPICMGGVLNSLPTTSTNAITGTWAPPINNLATTTYTFTPAAGQNATTAVMQIVVNPNVIPLFTAVAPIASAGVLAPLPTTSLNGVSGTWSPALNNTATTTYTFMPTLGQCATTATLTITVTTNNTNPITPSQNQNYIKTTTYRESNATNPVTSITYFDGLGRPMQKIAGRQSNSGKDIVTPIEYDAFGRQTKDYLPYASTQDNLAFIDLPSALTDVNKFYNTPAYENTLNPFSEKLLEASPLNRVLQQAAPGNDWSLAKNHTIKFDYQTNTASDAVKLFSISATWDATKGLYDIPTSLTAGSYADFQLYKTITKDENWKTTDLNNNTTEEFKDKEGKVVLKRTYNAGTAHDTYYIYDIYGNLTFVLPPLVDTKMSITQTILDNLCYQYKYDYRNRLVEKKLPGKQWEFIVYDKLDRVVATGPALSPFSDLSGNGWLITKYDAFNRPVYTAWTAAAATAAARKTMQEDRNNASSNFNEYKTTTDTTINGIAFRYSTVALPTSGYHVLTVNYYDDYDYSSAPTAFGTVEGQAVFYNNTTTKPKTMPTGSYVRVLETSTLYNAEKSYTLYDYKARPIRTYTANHLGGFMQVDSKVDFMGKTLYTITTHSRNNATAVITTKEAFTYTDQDKLLTHTHQINNGAIQLLVKNEYDQLGQLITKRVGGTDVNGTTPLQKVDYSYNIRGWLTGINDINSLTAGGSPTDLFSFKINYNTVSNTSDYTGKELFNGNISETFWKTNSDDILRKYGYFYDNLNRLTDAVYQKPNFKATRSYNESLEYDKNGNIIKLNRNGEIDDNDYPISIDKLDYVYATNSNQLSKIDDSSNNPNGFKDGTNINDDYSYDANGNMIADANKNITNITYNHLNLPILINFYFPNNQYNLKIEYVYNALGNKVKKIVYDKTAGQNDIKTTDYLSGFQYYSLISPVQGSFSSKLLFFPTAEGYVNHEAGVYNYVYNYTDHLGNVRLSYSDSNKDNAIATSEVVEENNYYPFGLKHSGYNSGNLQANYKYKYNGKELQDELGLNVYDYGFRNYDTAIGRWVNVDPLAEDYMSYSPYNYCLNNVVNLIDPDGRSVDSTYGVDDKGNVKKIDDKKYFDKNGKEVDKLVKLDKQGKKTEKSINVEKDVLKTNKGKAEKGSYDYFFAKYGENSTKLYEFLAENTSVEWGKVDEDNKNTWITTSHKKDTEYGSADLLFSFLAEGTNSSYKHSHSHPLVGGIPGYTGPSGFNPKDIHYGAGDKSFVKALRAEYPKNYVPTNVYDVKTQSYVNYSTQGYSSPSKKK